MSQVGEVGDNNAALVEFITRFKNAKLDWDGENIADLLWLAKYLDAPPGKDTETAQSEKEKHKSQTTTSNIISAPPERKLPLEPEINLYPASSQTEQQPTKEKTPTPGIPFKTPTAPALRQTLAIGRSLRPLMRKVDSYTQTALDEEATAEQTAERRFCTTIMKPVRERWLEVALVIEETPSTFIWEETIREFKLLLEQQGAFRSVRTWYLQTSQPDKLPLLAQRPSPGSKPSPRSYKELIDAAGRRLILLVSDCISPAWWQGQIQQKCLQLWAQNGPVAIVQPLPGKLWGRTALSAGLSVNLEAMKPGAFNEQLLLRDVPIWEDPIGEDSQSKDGLKLPIITLQPASLEKWSRMVAGFGDSQATGIWFDPGWQRQAAPQSSDLTAEQLVKRFNTTASETARDLGALMSLTFHGIFERGIWLASITC